MPAVAEVNFKATNSQQVVTAFKSVGTAANDTTTKINQNSNAMKQVGTNMKSSIGGIGQMVSAFATLSLSIVNTWRAYRDLEDAQIAIDAQTKKLHSTELAISNTEAAIAKERKVGKKGGVDYALATAKISKAEAQLKKDRKEGKKSAGDLRIEELEIQKAREELNKSSPKLAALEEKLSILKEQHAITTDRLSEAQEAYNDGVQNFYLSIVPTALSSVGLLTQAFSGFGRTLSGPGGLAAGLGPIGLILGGLSLAIIAFQTNFLGFRDVVSGVIDFVKDRFGAWQKTIQEVFGLIRAGDWGGAFNRIKEAAIAFWNDLVHTVPFFGGINKIVDAIRQGKWDTAFNIIKQAAVQFWTDLKTAVPFLADVENFIISLSKGDWAGVFKAVMSAWQNSGLPQMIENFFGKNWKVGLDAKIAEIGASFGLVRDAIENKDWASAFGAIKNAAETSGIDTLIDKLISPTVTITADWVATLLDNIAAGINAVADAAIASSDAPASMDTVWTQIIEAVDWLTLAGTMVFNLFAGIGMYLTSKFLGPLEKIMGASLKATFAGQRLMVVMQNAGIELMNSFIKGLAINSFGVTLARLFGLITPEVEKKLKEWEPFPTIPVPEFDEGELDATVAAEMAKLREKLGQGPKAKIGVAGDTTTLETAVSQTIKNINGTSANMPVGMDKEKFNLSLQDQLAKVKGMDPANLPMDLNTTPAQKTLATEKTKINTAPPATLQITGDTTKLETEATDMIKKLEEKKVPPVVITADTTKGNQTLSQFGTTVNNVTKPKTQVTTSRVYGMNHVVALGKSIAALKNKTVTVTTVMRTVGGQAVARGRSAGGQGLGGVFTGHQHGYAGTIRKPTLLMVGEGGRPEDITIRNRGSSVNQQARGQGQRGGKVKIDIDPPQFAAFMKASFTWGDDTYR
jgi:hypothetical protein